MLYMCYLIYFALSGTHVMAKLLIYPLCSIVDRAFLMKPQKTVNMSKLPKQSRAQGRKKKKI